MADPKHTYVYRAINDEGVSLSGDIEADSPEQARQIPWAGGSCPRK
ncbi:MAG: hypothetical protein V8Q84_00915 [Bilophila sp.]